jgi:hypothetical protein
MKEGEEGAMRLDTHLDPETLVQYHAERLTESDDRMVEEHLATCDACAALSRHVFRLSSDWDRLMTPAAKWASVRVGHEALPQAARESTWLDGLVGTLQGAALITLEGARLTIKSCARLVTAITPPSSANIDAILTPNATWSFDFVPEAARGAGRGADAEASGAARRSLPSVVEAKSQQKGLLRVALDQVTKRIVVTIDRFPAEPEPLPVVKLMRRNGPTQAGSWTVTRSGSGFRDLRAVFVVHEADDYVVGTE